MTPDLTDAEVDDYVPPMNIRQAMAWMDENWQSCIVGPGLSGVDGYTPASAVPACSGLYFLWSQANILLYVGISTNIAARVRAHFKKCRVNFSAVSWHEVDREVCPFVETAYIDALQPPCNGKSEPVRWRGHDAMVEAIHAAWSGALRKVTQA